MDPTLVRDLFLIECYNSDPSEKNQRRLKACGISINADPELRVFCHFKDLPSVKDKNDLLANNVKLYEHTYIPPIGAHSTGFMLADVRVSNIQNILKSGNVSRITSAYRQLHSLNDNTAQHTGAAEAWEEDPPITGEGVRLAILDSGFQFDHEDLPNPVVAMDYADYPDTCEDATDYISGHGTHVAGTAFGSGRLSNGRWRGMAYEADPIYLKIGNDSTADASSAAVVGAIRAAATWCEADIMTMSYGGSDGFNDGSSAEEQAVDWAVGEGTTVFMSAGNSASSKEFYSGEVGARDTTDLIQIITKDVSDPTEWSFIISWYDGHDEDVHINLSARIFDGDNELIEYNEMDQVSSPRGTEAREYLPVEPMPEDSTSFFVQVINHSDRDQQFHIVTYSDHWYVKFRRYSSRYTVGSPSTADSCISVGAFIARNEWQDFLGELHSIAWDTIGRTTHFSSIGPRIDGVLKPDITAPGQRTISCRDGYNINLGGSADYIIISNDGGEGEPADYIAMMGTSMSSPAAAGTAALILQARPNLNPSLLRNRIFVGARTDRFTGEVPNNVYGWGKIDVIGALSVPNNQNGDFAFPSKCRLVSVYPNPFNNAFNVQYLANKSGVVQFILYDITGREVWSSERYLSQPGMRKLMFHNNMENEASGTYMLSVIDRDRNIIKPVTLIK